MDLPSLGTVDLSLLSQVLTLFSHCLQLILLSCVMGPVKTVREGLSSEKDLGMSTHQAWKTPTMAFPALIWAPTTTTWSLSMETPMLVSLGGSPTASITADLSTTAQGGPRPATCPAKLVSTGRHREVPSLPACAHGGCLAAPTPARGLQAWSKLCSWQL